MPSCTKSARGRTYISVIVNKISDGDFLRIDFNINFPVLSCEFVSVDVSDVLGTNMLNITKAVRKFSMDSSFYPIRTPRFQHYLSAVRMIYQTIILEVGSCHHRNGFYRVKRSGGAFDDVGRWSYGRDGLLDTFGHRH